MTDPARPPDSSAAPEPDQPRLGIRHLFVWTACVAVYFSLTRPVYDAFQGPDGDFPLLWLLQGVGAGSALGGLLLWAARRPRGLPFPSQPGEWILILHGVVTAVRTTGYLPFVLFDSQAIAGTCYAAAWHLAYTITIALYLIAATRVKTRRWRVGLIALAAINLVRWSPFDALLSIAVLLTVVFLDVRHDIHWRWTHWLGVAIELWISTTTLIYAVLQVLFLNY